MLPIILKKEDTRFDAGEDWETYLEKVGDYSKTIDKDFLSQICLEHYERFNEYFPKFDIEKHSITRRQFTAEKIYSDIRYDHDKKLDFWYFQMYEFLEGTSKLQYPLLKYCGTNHTLPFPPVIVEHSFGYLLGGENLGKPFHLIEGTHRASFINRLFERNIINPDSIHDLIVIEP